MKLREIQNPQLTYGRKFRNRTELRAWILGSQQDGELNTRLGVYAK